MQDRLVMGLARKPNVRVRVKGQMVRLCDLPECRAVIASPFQGSSVMIGIVDDRIIVRGNPIGFLTNQNWIGTNDAYALSHRLLEALEEFQLVDWGRELRTLIAADRINFHELAFAMYVDCGRLQNKLTDLLKSTYGAISQHINPKHPIDVHLYHGPGLILRTASASLTIYDKYTKTYKDNPNWKHKVVTDAHTTALQQSLRIECTVKYNWFGLRREFSHWRNADWDGIEHDLFADFLGKRFHLEYVMRCPNVWDPSFTARWSPKDREAFALWMKNQPIDARTARRLYQRHGFDCGLSVDGHRNLAWTMLRPDCLRVPHNFDPRNVTTTPGAKLLAQFSPLVAKLHPGADDKTLQRIDKLCGIGKGKD